MIIKVKYIAYVTKGEKSKEVTVGLHNGTQIDLDLSDRDKFIRDVENCEDDFINTEDYE